MREKRVFGELEMVILKLFSKNAQLTVKDVQHALGGEDKYTTIMTVMNRLVEKNQLMRTKLGLQYEYRLNQVVNPAPAGLLERVKQRLFGGKSVSMISFLIESSEDITDKELQEMEKLIQKTRAARK